MPRLYKNNTKFRIRETQNISACAESSRKKIRRKKEKRVAQPMNAVIRRTKNTEGDIQKYRQLGY